MNFALPAATLLLLLLPGIAAIHGFLGRIGRKSAEPIAAPGITWTWLFAFLVAPAIHLVWISLLTKFGAPAVDWSAVMTLLAGRFDEAKPFSDLTNAVTRQPWHIVGYLLGVVLFGYLVGLGLQWIIRKFQLDLRFRILQFGTDWHYLFSGERIGKPKPDFVLVAITVDHGSSCYLYLGVLRNHAVDRNGDLQRIQLARAMRRKLEDDDAEGRKASHEDRFYSIK